MPKNQIFKYLGPYSQNFLMQICKIFVTLTWGRIFSQVRPSFLTRSQLMSRNGRPFFGIFSCEQVLKVCSQKETTCEWPSRNRYLWIHAWFGLKIFHRCQCIKECSLEQKIYWAKKMLPHRDWVFNHITTYQWLQKSSKNLSRYQAGTNDETPSLWFVLGKTEILSRFCRIFQQINLYPGLLFLKNLQ